MKVCTLFMLPEGSEPADPDEELDTIKWRYVGMSLVADNHEFGLDKNRRLFHLEGKIEKVEG